MKPALSFALAASALALAGPAHAQLLTHKALSYAMVKQIAEGAVEACQQMGYHVSATVVDRDGTVLGQFRGDNAPPHTLEASMRKAYTAMIFGKPSASVAEELAQPNNSRELQITTLHNVFGVAGGLPIKTGNETIGGVGVAGSPMGYADGCAQAGIDRVAAQLR
jgi:uncharacterized protein GlcG (DUF336 family)